MAESSGTLAAADGSLGDGGMRGMVTEEWGRGWVELRRGYGGRLVRKGGQGELRLARIRAEPVAAMAVLGSEESSSGSAERLGGIRGRWGGRR
jgi:hypothetical protein